MFNEELIEKQELIDRRIVSGVLSSEFEELNVTSLPITANTDLTITATTFNNTKIMYNVEIKSRNMNLNDYDNCFLEVEKYIHLVNDMQSHVPLYVAIYPEDMIVCVWNLDKIDMQKVERRFQRMQKVTFSNNNKKVIKEVYLLPIELSTKYKYKYAIDCKIA